MPDAEAETGTYAGLAAAGDPQSLGQSLGPLLRQTCNGRLGEINWFRATWQHGGAATGYSTWTFDDGRRVDAVVKLPVNFTEWFWTVSLGGVDHGHWERAGDCPTPRVLAGGEQLAGYDLAWLVFERLQGPTLAGGLDKAGVKELLHFAAEFHARAESVRPIAEARPPAQEDWGAELEQAREACRGDRIENAQHWNALLKQLARALPSLVARWRARPIDTWCHGDLHAHNAMHRTSPSGDPASNGGAAGRCVLIDLALVHPGCWIEDALYLERLYWARPEALHGVKVVQTLGKYRRENGLAGNGDASELANIRRTLMAATAPAFLATEGRPAHLAAALGVLERLLPMVTR